MTFCYKVGSQDHTLSGFGLQAVWDAPLVNILPNNVTDVYLVVHGSISLDVDFRGYADSTDLGSLGVVSTNPTLTLCDGSIVRGWHLAWNRTLYNAVVINRVTPVAGTWTFDLWVSGTGTPGYCEYGTQVQPGVKRSFILDEAVLAGAAIIQPELAWLAVPFGALVGLLATPGTFCDGPPPDMPVFDDGDFILGGHFPSGSYIPKLMQAFVRITWNNYCECLPPPGPGLLPAPPPIGTTPQPVTTPDTPRPVIVCDNSDICGILNSITNYFQTINNSVQNIQNDNRITINQTFAINFEIGNVNVGLSGGGTLAVSDILGVSVNVTTVPPGVSSDMDPTVPSYTTLGHINLGTASGYVRKHAITHEHFMLLEISPAVTSVEYELAAGVVADVSTLIRPA